MYFIFHKDKTDVQKSQQAAYSLNTVFIKDQTSVHTDCVCIFSVHTEVFSPHLYACGTPALVDSVRVRALTLTWRTSACNHKKIDDLLFKWNCHLANANAFNGPCIYEVLVYGRYGVYAYVRHANMQVPLHKNDWQNNMETMFFCTVCVLLSYSGWFACLCCAVMKCNTGGSHKSLSPSLCCLSPSVIKNNILC